MINDFKLSVVIPVYNEQDTIAQLIEVVRNAPVKNKEIIIVDDYSTDNTRQILQNIKTANPDLVDKIIFLEKNYGKGYAVRKGLKCAAGDFIIIQDADLEYDPQEYPRLLGPLLLGKADVVYGSRFFGGGADAHRALYFWHYMGNKFLTLLSNMFTNINLTDMETCYKAFTKEASDSLDLQENRFGFEPEITAKFAKKKYRIYEVGISYWGRTYAEGKHINYKDGFRALWCIIKYNLFS
ncbi:MAG: glycosyltransferase family 2 protein [Elusimicrobiota bacterium]|jgi:glycosyltransferase involved in cell wall biosynthesis|nr:glycosyltransferase family 2 protein [Elusimicrobiota bacterium]